MDKNDGGTDWGQLATEWGTLISLLITALSLGLDSFALLPQIRWSVVALLSFVIFCFLVWRWISGLNSELNNRTPKIGVHGDPISHDVRMGYTKPDGVFEEIAVSNMAAVLFSNNPQPRTDKNHATSIRAEITYLNDNRKVLFGPIQGRWGQTFQPSEIKRSQGPLIESVDFPNNGAVRSLDFLIKYPEDDYCYAFNNDSYDFGYLFQNPAYVIKSRKFIIQIRLKGPFISDEPFEFDVITKGKNDTYKIRKRDGEWQKMTDSRATKTLPKQKKPSRRKTSSKP
jgi:hypothetical protein